MTTHNHPSLPLQVRDRARSLRAGQSDSESFLWDLLRGRRLNGVKFRRQHPFPPYTIDFYADEYRVAVELDGELHELQKEDDARRDATLARNGIATLRLTTADLFGNPEAALERILRFLTTR